MDLLDLPAPQDLTAIQDPKVTLVHQALLERRVTSWPFWVRKEKRVIKGFVAHPALLDVQLMKSSDHPRSIYLDHGGRQEIKERKERKAFASFIRMVSKVIQAHLDQEANLARMERMGVREKRAFLAFLDTLVPRVKKEKKDHQVMVVVPLVLLAPEVSQDYKDKKVFVAPRERQVLQAVLLKGLVERVVRRETWVRKETGGLKENL